MMKHGVETDLVELDPAVYDYAKEYFGLLPDHTAHIMDAVQYVNDAVVMEPRPVYDYIIHDVFTGGAVPASLFTVELLTGLKSLLAKDGAIAIVSIIARNPCNSDIYLHEELLTICADRTTQVI